MWYWQPSIIYCLPRFRWRPTSIKWVQLQILSLHNKISVLYCICKRSIQKRIKRLILAGLEPAIPWFVVRCLIRWATGPPLIKNSWFCRCLLHDCYKMAANIETGGLVLKSSRSTFLLSCSYSRDSSVGRALDWRSKGPRFDPGSRHFYAK